jgi:hypothetical protein
VIPDPPTMTDSQRLVRIETLLEGITKGNADHETRIRQLERWRWLATGLAGGIGGVLGQAIQNMLGQ